MGLVAVFLVEAMARRDHVVGVFETRADPGQAHVGADPQRRVALGAPVRADEAAGALIEGRVGQLARLFVGGYHHVADVFAALADGVGEYLRAAAAFPRAGVGAGAGRVDALAADGVPPGYRDLGYLLGQVGDELDAL